MGAGAGAHLPFWFVRPALSDRFDLEFEAAARRFDGDGFADFCAQ